MTSLAILNTLLRVNGVSGEPPAPFERPNAKMDFWVLELPAHADVESWCAHTAQVLTTQEECLDGMRRAGFRLTLFVELVSMVSVLRLESVFLKMLADHGISLECSHEDA